MANQSIHSIAQPSVSVSNPFTTPITVAGNTYPAPIDHAIQGKMLKCETSITLLEWETHPAEWVKEKMLRLMLDEMMKEHCIEFTMTKDNHMDMVKVRARVFVTPDDKIRLLRTNGV